LIRRLAIARQGRQAQQTHALLTSTEADAAKRQDVPIEALGADIAQVGHACELAFEPAPAAWLTDKPWPVKQSAREPVTGPRLEL